MMERLTEEQITKELEQLPKWKRLDEKWVARKYHFKNFLAGVRFVDEIAEYAEGKNHHPFISIDYKAVTLKITSWQAKGLTDLDFEMINHFDELYEAAEK
ncbi:4a-hydroxytetrahydrobiopterin dehydratase [Virgibacillus sp. FSP13]